MFNLSQNAEYGSHLTPFTSKQKNQRGYNVYHLSEIMGIAGQTKTGEMISTQYQRPIFILSPDERENLARITDTVFGIVTSRMNKISSLEWNVLRKIDEEDKIAEELKSFKQIFDEYDNVADVNQAVIRRRALINIKQELVDIKDDTSNFFPALRRWKRRLSQNTENKAQEIKDWINNANSEDDFEEFKKKWVFDLMIHGSEAIYKQYIDGSLENFYLLPGGSVFPLRSEFVGPSTGFVQILSGYEPKIYFSDEMIFDSYAPVSARSYGLIPLEALINKIAESLLFDKLAAERADGTKPPEKLIILGDTSKMFGDLNSMQFDVPKNPEEQKRIETIVNEERKNAIRVLSGIGTPVIADISKADTFAAQSERQEKIIKSIAHVFGATPMEMGLTGSADTSGRNTSESQERMERERGVFPIVRIIDKTFTSKLIPYKFGSGWMLEHKTGLTDSEQVRLDTQKLASGTYSVNQIKEKRGEGTYPEEQYDRPPQVDQNQGIPGSNELSPMFTRQT